jgi:hypothetical protein
LARHRTSSSTGPSAIVELALRTAAPRTAVPEEVVAARVETPATARPATTPVAPAVVTLRGVHRVPAPPAALRGRVVAAAVAAGAFVAAGQALGPSDTSGTTTSADVALAAGSAPLGTGGAALAVPQVLTVAKAADPVATEQLAKGQRLGAERAAREAQARRPLYVVPAVGTFTSGFGARWGTQHLGIDIANSIGTPIVAVADGKVIESGPASGFGQWVRVQHDDGTITVYGHVDQLIAHAGDRVLAGQEIATIGNRGQSTGPHLHFEVWLHGTDKVDPQPWLAEHGIFVG